MIARDVRVGDDGAARRAEPLRDQLAGARQQPRPDQHVVGALAQRHVARCATLGAAGRGVALIGRTSRWLRRQQLPAKALDDLADDHLVRHVAALDGDVRLARRWDSASSMRFRSTASGIAGLEQRAVAALADAAHEQRQLRLQPDRNAALGDGGPRLRVHEGAAAGRQHLRARAQQPREHLALAFAEVGLAVVGEDVVDALAGRLLDLLVGIDERQRRAWRRGAARWPTCRSPSARRARPIAARGQCGSRAAIGRLASSFSSDRGRIDG